MPAFIPGLELSGRFYAEAVRPVLDRHFPGLPHAAGRLGWGSEVLGFDNEMSTDHNWGPIVQLFLREEERGLAAQVSAALERDLPVAFLGVLVRFSRADTEQAPRHWVEIATARDFWHWWLGWEGDGEPTPADWLTFPSQKLLALTTGAVYHDGVGELTRLRQIFAFYPHDLWLYLLAAGWQRIGQEEHLMPRAGIVGDEIGAALIGARLVRDVMRLAFLIERRYAPYPKWFGSAFARLEAAAELTPPLWRAQTAATWGERAAAIGEACVILARRHNALALTPPLPERLAPFHGRPFLVIGGSEIAETIRAAITDPAVRAIAARLLIGGIDQISDNTDLLEDAGWRPALRRLYTMDEV